MNASPDSAESRTFHGRTGSILFRASASDGIMTVDPYKMEREGTRMIEKARPEFTGAIREALQKIIGGPALHRAYATIVADEQVIVSETFPAGGNTLKVDEKDHYAFVNVLPI